MTETTQELLARLTGFTPGPWISHAARVGGDIAVVTENRDIIGEVFEDIRHDRENARDECSENAALIAAAPTLHRIATEQAAEIERLTMQRDEAHFQFKRLSEVLSSFRYEWCADKAKQAAEIARLRDALKTIDVGDGWAALIARAALGEQT